MQCPSATWTCSGCLLDLLVLTHIRSKAGDYNVDCPLAFMQVRAFEHALRVLSPWFTPDLMTRLTVSSIDGYQGREADVVLFSAVRWA